MARRIGDVIRQVSSRIPTGQASPPRESPELCPHCRGAGWLRMEAVDVDDPNFGRLIMCECLMGEVEDRRKTEMREKSNSDTYDALRFENFDVGASPAARQAAEIARAYAENPGSHWLLLSGAVGTGKTHLAAAVLNRSIERGVDAIIWTVPDLLDYLREAFNPTSLVTYDQRFEDIRKVSVLVLDDLGTESATPWAREKLYQLSNHRYNAQLPTVITTNQDLDSIDFRIRSRMLDRSLTRHVRLDGPDYRQRKKRPPAP